VRGILIAFLFAVAGALQLPAQATSAPSRMVIPMRDHVKLAAEVWLPTEPGRKPVLLVRTPYGRGALGVRDWAAYFTTRGYGFVIEDTRGRGDSEGQFDFLFPEGKDGYDTIEWIARQPWSNGRVGMAGLSYLGTVQWLAAREHPPHLSCIAPTAAGGRWFEEVPYMGGAFLESWALDFANSTAPSAAGAADPDSIDWGHVLAHRPLVSADSVLGRRLSLYQEMLAHSTLDAYWRRLVFTRADFSNIDVPTLTTTGWYDGDQPGALVYWRGMMASAPHRARHFLIVGAWRHPETFRGGSTKVGDTELSAESVIDMKATQLAFFEWCLKRVSPRFEAPRARVYVTGSNEWRSLDAYPPTTITRRSLYLVGAGHAASSSGDGRLTWDAPTASPPDSFTFDPKQPVADEFESWGADRRAIQGRQDVLVYTSEALQRPLTVIGSVVVRLQAATDGLDTDFTAVLSDVLPDGRALRLGPHLGIRRARFRRNYEHELLMTPGRSDLIEIPLFDIAHTFGPGHRMRLEISSSSAPTYAVNQNTGGPIATDTTWRVAHQTVFHERGRQSSVVLPVESTPEPAP